MDVFYFSAGSSVYEIKKEEQGWVMEERPTPAPFLCLAADPSRKGRLYGGTFNEGLWISNDSGKTWMPAGSGITHNRVMSVAVSPTEVKNGYHVVWAGTEPSGLFRSEDGGETWSDCPALLDLPSKSSWSFPPRPYTHHVRWIEPDRHEENRIFVGIELGGVMKSEDKGASWEDRKPDSQYDCHALTMHPRVTGRIYEAAGGGYAESFDSGNTWKTVNQGLGSYNYLVHIAVDAGNADTMVAAAAQGPYEAYDPARARTIVVRRENGDSWSSVEHGLPAAEGSSVFALTSHPSKAGFFYAVNNRGFYLSDDAGKTWESALADWPDYLKTKRIHGFVMVASLD
ncbi:WD40/YVTN/BNR-like repeat-containing protein [Oceanobacillus locisalsi]|uniref:WD40/YVTN/BNR-like repeat-containing protein n=1 Tax=Oceanobacillus locisalsi TaxID=546107 RepID=A0ABW3NJW8_9BACI